MTKHLDEWNKFKADRLRSAKKWLKYMPRRSTFKKYAVLNWFGDSMLKRRYLWSFKSEHVVPALYSGWILTLLPVMGAQTFIAAALALIFRANVMILIALQMISNPLTVGFLWPIEYKVGKIFLKLLDKTNNLGLQGTAYEVLGQNGNGASRGTAFLKVTLAVCIGGVILGYLMGLISSIFYKKASAKAITSYEQFVKHKEKSNAK